VHSRGPAVRAAYKLGQEHARRELSDDVNAAKILRGAAASLGKCPPPDWRPVLSRAGYDIPDAAWSALTDARRGEALLVALACTSDVEDPGGAPEWMKAFDAFDGPEGCAF
jgi:hypothetical protein